MIVAHGKGAIVHKGLTPHLVWKRLCSAASGNRQAVQEDSSDILKRPFEPGPEDCCQASLHTLSTTSAHTLKDSAERLLRHASNNKHIAKALRLLYIVLENCSPACAEWLSGMRVGGISEGPCRLQHAIGQASGQATSQSCGGPLCRPGA